MSKEDYQKLMDQTFKGSFISNALTKLLSKEISLQDFNKLLSQKKTEISSKNPSLSEEQKYQLLMISKDETPEKPSQPSESTKLLENNEKTEKNEKNELQKSIQNNFPFYYLILTISALALSMLMTAANIKLGKPALISNEFETSTGNFKLFEDANDNNQDLEISSIGQDMKLNINFKKNSLLILPKMKKIIFPTFEGLLSFIIKYGLSIVNVSVALFGRFFDKKNIKWLKIRVATIFVLLPIIRIYMLYKINNDFLTNYGNQNIEFYKSKELFQYNPRSLPYNLYNEIAHSLFSMFLALNHVSAYVVDAFYKSNNVVCEYIQNIFKLKNKIN